MELDHRIVKGNAMSSLELPYTDRRIVSFEIPAGSVARVQRPTVVAPVETPEALITGALDSPLGSERIEERVKPGDRVLIICDDVTRPTPVNQLIPRILARLNGAGVSDKSIQVLFALGTHREMTESEMRSKVGDEVLQRVACHNHNAFDKAALDYFGKSVDGVDVWLNGRINDASFVVGVGNIAPHPIVGYGGGAKILYPGVAGEETVAGFHVALNLDPTNYYGVIPCPGRISIDHLADVAGLDFVVDTLLDNNGRIYAVLGGDHRAVLEEGTRLAKRLYGVPVDHLYDVVVVSSYPAWLEFWQACKGAFAGATLAKPRGEIILVTACPEGCATTHPDHATYVGMKSEVLASGLCRQEFDDAVCAAGALKVAFLREQYHISVVSEGLSPNEIGLMGFDRYGTIEEALAAALSRKGPQDEIGVIPYGGHTYCYLETK